MPLCSRLRPDVRDRQTSDVRQTSDLRRASSLNAAYPRGKGITTFVVIPGEWTEERNDGGQSSVMVEARLYDL